MPSSFALYSAFLLGCLHAVEPGHGKTAIVAYLVGQRGSLLPALALGFSNALTHGFSIFFLALAINSGVSYFGLLNSDDAVALFTRFSGMTIMLLSLWFVVRERRSLARQECCEPTIVGLSDLQAIDSLWKQVRFSFLMGVGGGLVPCGTALSMYLASVAQGEFERGILSILIFSAGILVSVTLTTWILLHSLRVVKFLQKPGLEKKLLWLRFAIMFGTGFVLVFF